MDSVPNELASSRQLRLTKFRELSLDDPFFDSLKATYRNTFEEWFSKKANEELYVVVDNGSRLSGMIYLKEETGPITDVKPLLSAGKWLKVGTLKVEGRGTKLGERILKKILDTAIAAGMSGIYITVFELHEDIVRLFGRYGFTQRSIKQSADGTELVLVRQLAEFVGDNSSDYPFIRTSGKKAWLLAVYPKYHSQLLPDSILTNEPREIVRDVSHTNTIHKAYIGRVPLDRMSTGDIIVMYRTSDGQGPARYRSVATSLCVVEEIRSKRDFENAHDFATYVSPHSVFSEAELRKQFETNHQLFVARMTYNVAFSKRVTRGRLLDEVRISDQPRWDLRELTRDQLRAIIQMGNVDARLIID
jgi:hypothetical protein